MELNQIEKTQNQTWISIDNERKDLDTKKEQFEKDKKDLEQSKKTYKKRVENAIKRKRKEVVRVGCVIVNYYTILFIFTILMLWIISDNIRNDLFSLAESIYLGIDEIIALYDSNMTAAIICCVIVLLFVLVALFGLIRYLSRVEQSVNRENIETAAIIIVDIFSLIRNFAPWRITWLIMIVVFAAYSYIAFADDVNKIRTAKSNKEMLEEAFDKI